MATARLSVQDILEEYPFPYDFVEVNPNQSEPEPYEGDDRICKSWKTPAMKFLIILQLNANP